MKIVFENNEYDIEENKTIKQAFANKINSDDIIAARYNNLIASLNHPIKKDGKISFITKSEKDGRIIYVRGLLYLMSKAFYDLYPKAYLTVNYQLSNAMFCEIENMEITQEVIDNVKRKNARNNRQRFTNTQSRNDSRRSKRILCKGGIITRKIANRHK